jgi:hypothetical protein
VRIGSATWRVVLLGVLASTVAGCGHLGSAENADASQAALTFDSDLRTPAEACRLLAPGTLAELDSSFGPCDHSLAKQHLPEGGRVVGVDVYGKDAMVRLDNDVIFLARFDNGWRVTAAGCAPRSGRPYDCTVKGR